MREVWKVKTMTNYDEEFPDMDPQVKADMEAEDALDAEEKRLEALKVDWRLFANKSEYYLMFGTIFGLIIALVLAYPAYNVDVAYRNTILCLEWMYMTCLAALYIRFF